MSNKFNLEALTGKTASSNITDNFKSTQDIFNKANSIVDSLPIDKLVPYSRHPFKVREGDRLNELINSIIEQGVLVPLIVRVHPNIKGSYEILAGHHRFEAANRIEMQELPCIIKNVDDNMAALIVVESNKQRGFADMLPSEIARALKLEYEALKCQGKRTDLMAQLDEILNEKSSANVDDSENGSALCPMGTKIDSGAIVGAKNSISRRDTFRYIRLNYLIPDLLVLVDIDDVAVRPAVDLSYLQASEQELVLNSIVDGYKVDMKKSEKLKEYSQANKLNEDTVKLILSGAIFEAKAKKVTTIKLPIKKIKEYIPASVSADEYEEYIIKALEAYEGEMI